MRLTRNIVVGVLAAASIAFAMDGPISSAQTAATSPAFHVNSQRLQASLEKLSEFGRNADGGEVHVRAIA